MHFLASAPARAPRRLPTSSPSARSTPGLTCSLSKPFSAPIRRLGGRSQRSPPSGCGGGGAFRPFFACRGRSSHLTPGEGGRSGACQGVAPRRRVLAELRRSSDALCRRRPPAGPPGSSPCGGWTGSFQGGEDCRLCGAAGALLVAACNAFLHTCSCQFGRHSCSFAAFAGDNGIMDNGIMAYTKV